MSSEPQEPDDRELEDFLSGKSPISRAYREAGAEDRAPLELDASILAAAREANREAAAPRATRRPRWIRPLAFAATFVLSVSVLFNVYRDPGLRWQAMPGGGTAESPAPRATAADRVAPPGIDSMPGAAADQLAPSSIDSTPGAATQPRPEAAGSAAEMERREVEETEPGSEVLQRREADAVRDKAAMTSKFKALESSAERKEPAGSGIGSLSNRVAPAASKPAEPAIASPSAPEPPKPAPPRAESRPESSNAGSAAGGAGFVPEPPSAPKTAAPAPAPPPDDNTVAAPADQPAYSPAVTAAPAAPATSAASPARDPSFDDRIQSPASAVTDRDAREKKAEPAAKSESRAYGAAPATQASPSAPPVDEWVAKIRKLRDNGDIEGARRELFVLRRLYPGYVLPQDLREIEAGAP